MLHRWSKQKTQADEEEINAPAETNQDSSPQSDGQISTADGAETEERKPIELPPIESLDEDSDYSIFMSPEVDESVRKLALRKLFKVPFFNIVDGLNDYDDDFTSFEALGDIVTADMKFHEERKKAEDLLRRQQTEESETIAESADAETSAHAETTEDETDEPAADGQGHQSPAAPMLTDEEKRTDDEEKNRSDQSIA